MNYSGAIVRFSEFDIAEACWPILLKFYVYRQKGSGQLNTIWGSFEQKWILLKMGAQWLSGRVLDSRPRGRGFEPHRRHCVVVLGQDTFILA